MAKMRIKATMDVRFVVLASLFIWGSRCHCARAQNYGTQPHRQHVPQAEDKRLQIPLRINGIQVLGGKQERAKPATTNRYLGTSNQSPQHSGSQRSNTVQPYPIQPYPGHQQYSAAQHAANRAYPGNVTGVSSVQNPKSLAPRGAPIFQNSKAPPTTIGGTLAAHANLYANGANASAPQNTMNQAYLPGGRIPIGQPLVPPSSVHQSSSNHARAPSYQYSSQSQNRGVPSIRAAYQDLLDESDSLGGDSLLDSSDDLLGEDSLLGADDEGDDDGLSALESLGPSEPIKSKRKLLPGAGHGSESAKQGDNAQGVDPHWEVFAESKYPSALACAKCHQQIYDEWRISAHAYSTVSPMFQKFEQKLSVLSQGTVGTFCLRCHAPVAMQLEMPRHASVLDAPYVYREGVTCVACHRVKERYGRVHGERRIEPGPLQDPVYGGIGGNGVAEVIANKDAYKVKLDPNDKSPGQPIHFEGIKFEQLGNSGFCQPCHQVAVHPGIALEVVWAQYRASPACKKGISCQDCHMGLVPGKAQGYAYGPAANMSGRTVNNNRKHSNHIFFGPGNSIAHPGLFPHNEKALRWSIDNWMEYDWRAGWGTKEFEKAVANRQIAVNFPPAWDSADERRDARLVLDDNFKMLDIKKASSIAVMEAGARIEGPYFPKHRPPELGKDLKMSFRVKNNSEGHNNPSGSLGAQPQLWLNVALRGPDGEWLWESGYLDPNGDLANQHSLYVTKGLIPPDRQLFNLQTQFLITGVKGTDREMYLPVNVDFDQLPFLRPGNIPVSVMNHPPFIRMEQKSIPPLGHKMAHYKIPGRLLCKRGTYRLTVRMRSRMEPIYFMRFCESTPEMERRMIEQTIDLHRYTLEFTIP